MAGQAALGAVPLPFLTPQGVTVQPPAPTAGFKILSVQ